jgi:hypothetical protein
MTDTYQITRAHLDSSSKNRPGPCSGSGCWAAVRGIVVHRTASSSMDAWAIRRYFNDSPDGRFASSQYVLDNNVILELMPVGEVAFHTRGKNLTHLGIETCEHNWGTKTWSQTYRKLVWLTAHLVRAHGLNATHVTGHFWWDPTDRPYDPTHMGWAPPKGKASGIFDWNQFIVDVQAELTPAPRALQAVAVRLQRAKVEDCTQGLLIDSTTYVPIRPYTSCLTPGAGVEWDASEPSVLVTPPTTTDAPTPSGSRAIPRRTPL